MMLSACIFDLDGVVCHTDEYHYLAWKRLCDFLGLRFDRPLNEQLRGVSRRESLEIILSHNDISLSEDALRDAMDRKNAWYREFLERMTPADLEPDVRPALTELHAMGLRLALGSSSRNARLILDRLGLFDMFDAVADGTMISRSKPDPEVFLKAAALIGIEPSRCVVVEDALSGIHAAKAAGMRCIAYRLHSPELEDSIPHAERFGEIVELVKSGISERK
ncbi:MAG: beta-phosphoglucomutase [Sphaerochaetaceae bacterium]|nr:beta-phosphoglucomutase [Sphaerochaetaceae bacterium]